MENKFWLSIKTRLGTHIIIHDDCVIEINTQGCLTPQQADDLRAMLDLIGDITHHSLWTELHYLIKGE